MNTLKLEMENCYGIQKIQQDIDFSKNNVAVIYAPNGTMKSSFAKTFEAIRDGKRTKIIKLLLPLIYPINCAILMYGGILTNIWI